MMNASSLSYSMRVETPQSSHYKVNGNCSQLVKTHYSPISYYNEFRSLRGLLYPTMIVFNNYYKKIGEMCGNVKDSVKDSVTTKFAKERFSISSSISSINKILIFMKIFGIAKLINKNEVVLK